jgi:SNF2 family DNA or RNA helicase
VLAGHRKNFSFNCNFGTFVYETKIKDLLIVCLLSVVGVWEEEFSKFADFDYELKILKGNTAKKFETLKTMSDQR